MRIVIDTNVLISGVVKTCRDPDDNKFLGNAKDSRSLYIVSGDKDLLVVAEYENIQIITAKEFCEKYFSG